MKNIYKNIISIVILGIVIFVFREPISSTFFALQNKYFPCSRPITYSIGSFDDRFKLSKDKFLSIINKAEGSWENPMNKELFTYSEDGVLKINLVYDKRQEA
ncbi:hypothetical protein COY23_01495, partial [bacterium (Candidatus Torokbacteria) CG_4_10_14_0_2_um_filter_35_8]